MTKKTRNYKESHMLSYSSTFAGLFVLFVKLRLTASASLAFFSKIPEIYDV